MLLKPQFRALLSLMLMPVIVSVIVLGLVMQVAAANSPSKITQSSAELEALRKQIQQIKQDIDQSRGEHSDLKKKLQLSESEIEKALLESRKLDASLKAKSKALESLKQQQRNKSAVLDQHKDFLKVQIRTAYMQPDQNMLKLAFNQDSKTDLSRMMMYHQYVTAARTEKITAVTDQLGELIDMQQVINVETEKLRLLRFSQQEHIEKLEKGRDQRHQIVNSLAQQISSKDARLSEMKNDENKLTALISSLKKALAKLKLAQKKTSGSSFDQLKGKLHWPVSGAISHRYGTPRDDSTLNWQGVLFSAKRGQDVRVISSGRVVFSDWFRNLGRLIIVDHGGGYLSLYGHNQELFHAVGDQLKTGEVIASVGDSGGRKNSGLYFEVRRQGVPVNPAIWCKRNF